MTTQSMMLSWRTVGMGSLLIAHMSLGKDGIEPDIGKIDELL